MILRFAGFELDQQHAELRGPDGAPVKLRPKTFEMLRLLVANPGRVLSKQELMEAVWPDIHVGEDSLFQCIREIRSALGDDRRQTIKLASGGGYIFTADVAAAADVPAPSPDVDPSETATAAGLDLGSPSPAQPATVPARSSWLPALGGRMAVIAVAGLCAIVGLAAAAPLLRSDLIFKRTPPVVAVMALTDASDDPIGPMMATEIAGRLTDGFARINTISVIAPRPAAAQPEQAAAPAASPDFEIRGELQRSGPSWTLRTRLIQTATGKVEAVAVISVDADERDPRLQQTRLAAGVGDVLARRLNELTEAGTSPADLSARAGGAKVAIEQATASINSVTQERFGMAQTMLQNALAEQPDNVDAAVALAALQMRGIQMVWYNPDAAAAAEAQAAANLERALRAKPNSIAVLETYCRFLSATNRFVESLVICARTLSLDPWDGLALYLVGLGQLHLGRFEDALATFQQADRYDTPAVSRWTWLLGVGWAYMMMDRADDALPWLQRSIAITAASGRPYLLLAATYQRAGQTEEAKAAIQKGLKLRPGTTALNVAPPMKNTSPVYREAAGRIVQLMVDAGLPAQ
ncbi:transcriptional regulator CadC [Bradyrhizobium oligotrophicum S58]|uniref:Transcriptional regulator CadC n=1 Tax=Bradyrhizobium oligotrophicum S58 TaxID=1245469 RepID=M4Z3P7_9BRAD|nr:winged helix-turn-helix domain-containing protein [Bradyrhizobium oligotrophicum]BAM87482.1 transcriptional regulator CadC [Bradyrhizobium oligotrophicum S58]